MSESSANRSKENFFFICEDFISIFAALIKPLEDSLQATKDQRKKSEEAKEPPNEFECFPHALNLAKWAEKSLQRLQTESAASMLPET